MDRVAGREHDAHEQTPVGLDADDHLHGSFGVLPAQGVQPGRALEGLRDAALASPSPLTATLGAGSVATATR
jgi:hypothetical protein